MRRKSPPRVVGPYLERGKWRILVVDNNARKSFFFLTEQEALKHKECGCIAPGEVSSRRRGGRRWHFWMRTSYRDGGSNYGPNERDDSAR